MKTYEIRLKGQQNQLMYPTPRKIKNVVGPGMSQKCTKMKNNKENNRLDKKSTKMMKNKGKKTVG